MNLSLDHKFYNIYVSWFKNVIMSYLSCELHQSDDCDLQASSMISAGDKLKFKQETLEIF